MRSHERRARAAPESAARGHAWVRGASVLVRERTREKEVVVLTLGQLEHRNLARGPSQDSFARVLAWSGDGGLEHAPDLGVLVVHCGRSHHDRVWRIWVVLRC